MVVTSATCRIQNEKELSMRNSWTLSIGEGRGHYSDVPPREFDEQDEDGFGLGHKVGACRLDDISSKKRFAGRSYTSTSIMLPKGIRYETER